MLGMMNCPTDGVDVYATSPTSRRLLQQVVMTESEEKKSSDESSEDSSNGETPKNELQVFVEVKKKRSISYTEDGRKMIDGKLQDENVVAPEGMWNRLIVNSLIGKISSPKRIDTNRKSKSDKKKATTSAEAEDITKYPAAAVSTEGKEKVRC